MRGRTALFSSKWSRAPSGRGNRVYGEEERIGAPNIVVLDIEEGAGIRACDDRLEGVPQEVQHSAAGTAEPGPTAPDVTLPIAGSDYLVSGCRRMLLLTQWAIRGLGWARQKGGQWCGRKMRSL